jgi:hypothetical protein
MANDPARLKRLRRIEKVRAVAKEMKLAESARAESTLHQLRGLAERTREMAAGYSARADPSDAGQLAGMLSFSQSLHRMSDKVSADAASAQHLADRLGRDVHAAERSRATAQERADDYQAALGRAAAMKYADAPGRKGFGTKFE